MATSTVVPADYRWALEGLAGACRECRALADLLDHFAADLRGNWVGPEGPPLESYPTGAQVRRALERRDRALTAATNVYLSLAWEIREGVPAPEDLLGDRAFDDF
jgi:hypothetical protein